MSGTNSLLTGTALILYVAAFLQVRNQTADLESNNKTEIAKQVGVLIGTKAVKAGIKSVSFDRNGYLYHGRVKSLADGAREAGLNF